MISALAPCELGEGDWHDCKQSCLEIFLPWFISSVWLTEKQAGTPYNSLSNNLLALALRSLFVKVTPRSNELFFAF